MKNEKLITVTFVKPHFRYAYFEGNIGKVRESELEELQNGGFVKYYPGDDGNGNENPLPEDLEARDLLFKEGFQTLEAVKAAGETLLDIKGIGKATLNAILEYGA